MVKKQVVALLRSNVHLRYLNLKQPVSWRCSVPFSSKYYDIQPSFAKPLVYKNSVWFFTGKLDVLRFDLNHERWDRVTTVFRGKWPFDSGIILIDRSSIFSVERYRNKLCVFGESLDEKSLFFVLNLDTLRWRKFDLMQKHANGDTVQMTPLGRISANVWVVEDQDKLFVMYGDTVVTTKERMIYSLVYADLWSFSFITETWTRERLRGNFPSPRLAMAHAYHSKLKKVIAFGGASWNERFFSAEQVEFVTHPHFGDTFVMDIDTLSWKQVVTRSFPAWRASARMLIDNADGKIYVYGG